MTCVIEIDTGAIRTNYEYLAKATSARVAGVVKADAYGLGVSSVVSTLLQAGCKEYFVATAREGKTLREEFRDIVIYVLEGALVDTAEQLVSYDLRPVLSTPNQCEIWSKTKKPSAIHVDTGMERLGLRADELPGVLGGADLDIQLLVSHFARADEPGQAFNQLQLDRFNQIYVSLKKRFPKIETSLGNSAGLLKQGPNDNLCRAGIALYGGNPFSDRSNPMKPVVSMKVQALQIREVPKGVPVGYGGTYETRQDCVLATVGAGYADGVPRALSNKGHAYVLGSLCPVVGRVSMDTLHLDVTGLAVREGDWIELIGRNVSLDEFALLSGTIPYEILTGLGRRCSRVYVG